MEISDLVQLAKEYPYLTGASIAVAAVGAAMMGFKALLHSPDKGLGKTHYTSSSTGPEPAREPEKEEEPESEYKPRSIAQAQKNDYSIISGVVEQVYNTDTGLAGVVNDSSGRAIFYLDYEDYYNDSKAVMSVLLNQSIATKSQLEMFVQINEDEDSQEGVLCVEGLKGAFDGKQYSIGETK